LEHDQLVLTPVRPMMATVSQTLLVGANWSYEVLIVPKAHERRVPQVCADDPFSKRYLHDHVRFYPSKGGHL
jgi:hypothetical protein